MESDPVRVIELPSEARALVPEVLLDGRALLAPGALLEWLLALQQLTPDRTGQLVELRYLPQLEYTLNSRVCYREGDRRALVTLGTRGFETIVLVVELSDAPAPPLASSASSCERWRETTDGARARARAPMDSVAFHAALSDSGIRTAPNARVVRELRLSATGAWARLELAADQAAEAEAFLVGPAQLEAALQLAFLFVRESRVAALAPLAPWPSIERVILGSGTGRPEALALRPAGSAEPDCACEQSAAVDVALLDVAGEPLVELLGVRFGSDSWVRDAAQIRIRAAIRGVVEGCLSVQDLPDDRDWTAHGAGSLDLVRIAHALDEQLGYCPSLGEMLATPNTQALSERVLRAGALLRSAAAPSNDGALAPIEAQLWFLERLTNVTPAYNEGYAFRVDGAFDLERFERALQHVQQRHLALQTFFPQRDGTPSREWAGHPLLLRSSALEPDALTRQLEAALRRPFDLVAAPPFRCDVFVAGAPGSPRTPSSRDGSVVVLLAAHHIACDAWSLERVLLPELCEAYASLHAGEPLPEAEAPAALQRGAATSPDALDRARARLHEAPHVLDFPYDRPRGNRQGHDGALVRAAIDLERWEALKALARELAVSPFVLMLALTQLLLHRYTRMPRFALGVPVSMRQSADDQARVGCLVQLAVLCARVEPDRSFAAHCQSVKAELVAALSEGPIALAELVRALAPARSLSHTPLVQAVFGFRERQDAPLAFPGTRVTPLPVHNRAAKFELSFGVADLGAHAELTLEYATDLLESASAARLLSHYLGLIAAVLDNPRVPVGVLDLRQAPERAWLAACEGETAEAASLGLSAALQAALRARGDDALVLRCGGDGWSVARLTNLAAQIATRLEDSAVHPGDYVALSLPRSPEWVASLLAILQLEAAYVPLDLVNPPERLRHALEQSAARALISRAGSGDGTGRIFPEPRVRVERIGSAEGADASYAAGARRPVYAILTSGSSGRPRMAAVAEDGFSNLVAWYCAALELGERDRVLVATSVGFDLTQKNVFAALLSGARLILDPAPLPDPGRLLDTIEAEGVTLLNCTPSLAYRLVAAGSERGFLKLRSLRALVLGGEPIDWLALQPWIDDPSCHVRIMNSYGPTECSDVVVAGWIDASSRRPLALGRPIPNAYSRVVELSAGAAAERGRAAATGIPGELWLRGIALGLGYLHDPEATQRRFIHAGEGAERALWYRTGDLVRRRDAGELEFLGRIDGQLKLRGYRIEPAEVEAALERSDEVQESAVVLGRDRAGHAILIAFLALDGSHALEPELAQEPALAPPELASALRRMLAARVPSYMHPSAFFTLARLPRTASGKLDRPGLRARAIDLAADRGEPLALAAESGDPLSVRVTRAWAHALGRSELTLDTHFFEAGGHSLAAIELTSALERELACELAIAALFEHPSLGEYIAFVREQLRPHGGRSAL